jgi:hypothetical protein
VLALAVARHYRQPATPRRARRRAVRTPLSPATKLHSTEALLATRAGLNETFADLAADLRVNVQLAERTAVFTPPSLVDLAVTTFGRIGDDPREERAASDDRVLLESRAFEVETGFDAIADTLHARSELRWQPARAPDDPTVVVPPDRIRDGSELWLGVWLDTIERRSAAAGPTSRPRPPCPAAGGEDRASPAVLTGSSNGLTLLFPAADHCTPRCARRPRCHTPPLPPPFSP